MALAVINVAVVAHTVKQEIMLPTLLTYFKECIEIICY